MFEGIYIIFLWDNKILFILYLKLRYNISIKIYYIYYTILFQISSQYFYGRSITKIILSIFRALM